MPLNMWMMDIAREQCPTLDHLRSYCRLTLDAGYDALGLYLEHRFAYPSTPWSHGKGCVLPEDISVLQQEFPGLQLIPFINLLGHFEGFLYTEEGKAFREARFSGMQACPSLPKFVKLCKDLIEDTVQAFDSEIIHIGGDETAQLGNCDNCAGFGDKSKLYGHHFGPLAELVVKHGRKPAVWGDMFVDHPEALGALPNETLIFDWQYFSGCRESAQRFVDQGFEVVACPTLQTYNSTWLNLQSSEDNVRKVQSDVVSMNLFGTCLTTWECALFGSYETLKPAIIACGQPLQEGGLMRGYLRDSETYEEWARLMGVELVEVGGLFAAGRIRSSLKVRLLLNANPFLAWLYHGEELSGEVGDMALDITERALSVAPNEITKAVAFFARSAVEFVRLANVASKEYASGRPESAISKLALTRTLFEDLGKVAKRNAQRDGASLADVERCRVAKEHVEKVITRIRNYGNRELGYLPSFEHLTHPKFVPHDQGAWWLVNRWANE